MSSAGPPSSQLTDRAVQALLQDVLVPCETGQDEPGDVLGPYQLVAKLGEGGFGVVWQARQSRPVEREVALKMIKLGMDSREVLARFEQERQVLAGMEHPNIASMLDAGMSTDGRPYFVMELVKGDPITLYCQLRHLPLQNRLMLFMAVCRGVQHAHQKGVIHRDLKPNNLLVTDVDGVPVPKIIDFGIAKAITTRRLADFSMMTLAGMAVGTPLYMSPEQVSETGQVDTRSDIYALGVLLYELLTGQPPFAVMTQAGKSQLELRRMICEVNPPRPSRLAKEHPASAGSANVVAAGLRLPADLDWIVLRALEKDPARRYPSAAGFCADLQRFLDHKPVTARPPSTTYLTARWIRRNRLGFAAAVVSVPALIGGAVVASWQAVEAKKAQIAAEGQTSRAVQAETRARQTADFLTGLLDDAAEEIGRGRNPEALHRALERNAGPLQELANDPELQSMLLQRVSNLYSNMGDWKSSLNLMETRSAVLARMHGPDSAEAMEAELDYLKHLANEGTRIAVPPRLETLLKRVESTGRQGSPFWFEVQRQRVRVLLKLDAGRQALALSKETMAMADRFKPNEKDLTFLQLSHSAALEEVGDYPAAEQMLMQCRRSSNGRIQAAVFNRLIQLLKRQGDHARAAGLLRERIANSREKALRENTDPITLLTSLGECESDAGQHDSAVGHAREALDLALTRTVSGEGNPDRSNAGDCLRALAMAESAAGRHAEAIGHAQEARRNATVQGHRAVLMKTITCEAKVLQAAGQLEQSYQCYQEGHELRQEGLANYRSRSMNLQPMWRIRMEQRRWEEAIALISGMWPQPEVDDPIAQTDIDYLGEVAGLGLETWAAWQLAQPEAQPPAALPQWQEAAAARALARADYGTEDPAPAKQ
jgi:serine/threonine protein kinase/tetratricopeptide (TPR) repeat protein